MGAETAKIHICEWMRVTAALERSRAGERRPLMAERTQSATGNANLLRMQRERESRQL